jgi:hypothetical protein
LLTELVGPAVELQPAAASVPAPEPKQVQQPQIIAGAPVLLQPVVADFSPRREINDLSESADVPRREAQRPAIELQMPELVKQSAIMADASTNFRQMELTQREIPQERQVLEVAPSFEPTLKASTVEILRDLKKIEITIRQEVVKEALKQAVVVEREAPRPEGELQIPERLKQSVITTDQIASLNETPLLPRAIPLARVLAEVKAPDRSKGAARLATTTSDATVACSASQFADSGRTADPVEQVRPAQPVEIPDMPKLQTVRTVAMEVGEAGSQVVIRIEERGGSVNLHFGTGNETLHRSIASSVELLVRALKQEKIEISNVEVFRKSPIDKVRRTKEAH